MGKTPGGGRNLKNKTFLLNSRGLLSSLCSAEIPVARPRADTKSVEGDVNSLKIGAR